MGAGAKIRVGLAAEQHGYAGRVRLEVVTRDLVDSALQPLAAEYETTELERAAAVLRAAIDCVGRASFSAEPVPRERIRADA